VLRRLAGNVVLYLCGVAVIVRLTVRDGFPWLAPVYYATPFPVIAAGLLVAAILLYRSTGHRLASWLAVLALCMGVAGLAVPAGYHRCEDSPEALHVLTWNMGYGDGGWQAEVDQAAGVDADLVLLVEAGDPTPVRRRMWRRSFPDRSIELAGGGLVLIARGRLDQVQLHELAGHTRVATAIATIDDQRWYVVLVDVSSNPFFARGPMLAQVDEIARARTDLPVIVTGDFNTPTGSVWLEPFESSFTHAFADAGHGFAGTWPSPLPVLAIDHLWTSAGVQVVCARHRWTLLSDHLQLVTALVFPRVVAGPSSAVSLSAAQAGGLPLFLVLAGLAGALGCLAAAAYVARYCFTALSSGLWPPPGVRAALDGRVLAGAAARRMAALGLLLAAVLALAGLILPLSAWRILALLKPGP